MVDQVAVQTEVMAVLVLAQAHQGKEIMEEVQLLVVEDMLAVVVEVLVR
jgi:hypothetical protein